MSGQEVAPEAACFPDQLQGRQKTRHAERGGEQQGQGKNLYGAKTPFGPCAPAAEDAESGNQADDTEESYDAREMMAVILPSESMV